MENSSTNPLIVILLFILRCLVPLIIMLGVSQLLRKFGLIRETTLPEEKQKEGDDNNLDEGDLAHGNV
jgi:hypothetical protein